jgi:hypothetical protein
MVLKKDSEWDKIDGSICRVISFDSYSLVKNGEILSFAKDEPYASVILECNGEQDNIKGFITHKIDFLNLRESFNDQVSGEESEVIIVWSKSRLKFLAKLFSLFMPKLVIWLCPKESYKLMTDNDYKKELSGELRYKAMAPIKEWKPFVIK